MTSVSTRIGFVLCSLCLWGTAEAGEQTSEAVQLGDGETVSFTREVMPVLQKAGCSAGECHGSFKGRGGFRLSLFGSDPQADYKRLAYEAGSRRVNRAAPQRSLFLLKPTTSIPHEGGHRFEKGSRSYNILKRWVEQGLPGPAEKKPTLKRLELTPTDPVIRQGKTARLEAKAFWSDGLTQDVRPWALYKSRHDRIVEVDEDGTLQALGPGRSAVTAQYMGQVAAVTVSVPYPSEEDSKSKSEGKDQEFQPQNFIDELVMKEWQKMGLEPAPLADDYTFIRRAYLDIIGTLPTPEEIRQFAESNEPDKRSKLIDELLERPEYAAYWTAKWGDLLRVHRRFLGEKGMWSFHGWLRRSIRQNKPLDELTRQLLTAKGNLYSNGPVAYYFVDKKADQLAETTAQVFLGVRMQCARCHHHPFEVWTQRDYSGLTNFFTRIEKKENGDNGKFGGAKLLRVSGGFNRSMWRGQRVAPQAFGQAKVEDPQETGDLRTALAEWITDEDNPFFARNWVNRYWAYLMGRGLIEPIDDLRATNPPTMPALMDALEQDFIEHGYDVKHLIRRICNSRVYQLAPRANPKRDEEGKFYSHRQYERLGAQVLLDAIVHATGVEENYPGMPKGTRAIELPDPGVNRDFLKTFGRSARANPCECASTTRPNLAQALELINGRSVDRRISSSGSRLNAMRKAGKSEEAIIRELYLWTFSRPPTAEEMQRTKQRIAAAPSRKEGLQDLYWALLNSTEFLFNH